MKKLRILLWPFAVVYDVITRARNFCFKTGIFKQEVYDFSVIGVGNLSVGGTGKTPVIEFLIRLLKDQYTLATLSRGYGRKTKGYLDVEPQFLAEEAGDEPLQFAKKFNQVQVAVCEKRSLGIKRLREKAEPPEVILLDDVYQHRHVKPGLLILLTAYDDLFYNDFVLPAGNLRESRIGANRADLVLVTKCPSSLSEASRTKIEKHVLSYTNAPLYFASITYGLPQSENGSINWNQLKNQDLVVVTGIAKPAPFLNYLNDLSLDYKYLQYADHHDFSDQELQKLDEYSCILTTEKDYMRLAGKLSRAQLYYLPISVELLDKAADFNAKVLDFVR